MPAGVSPQTLTLVWGVSLLLAVVVTVVVAVLLQAILSSARRILHVAGEIWTDGQRVARNTVQIALLERTNHLLQGLAQEVPPLGRAVQAIADAVAGAGGRS